MSLLDVILQGLNLRVSLVASFIGACVWFTFFVRQMAFHVQIEIMLSFKPLFAKGVAAHIGSLNIVQVHLVKLELLLCAENFTAPSVLALIQFLALRRELDIYWVHIKVVI